MTQNFTPNDLIKNLYEPEKGLTDFLSSENRSELAAFQQVKNTLDEGYLNPSDRCVDAIIAYSKRNIAIQSWNCFLPLPKA